MRRVAHTAHCRTITIAPGVHAAPLQLVKTSCRVARLAFRLAAEEREKIAMRARIAEELGGYLV